MSFARQVTALVCGLAPYGCELVCHAEREWRSATFDGSVHTVTIDLSGADAAEVAQVLGEQIGNIDLPIGGALCADARVLWSATQMLPEPRTRLAVELLLVNE